MKQIDPTQVEKLKALKDEDKIKIVRSMPWSIKKRAYRMIARKGTLTEIDQLIDSFEESFKQIPEVAAKHNYQRDYDYFLKMLDKFDRLK